MADTEGLCADPLEALGDFYNDEIGVAGGVVSDLHNIRQGVHPRHPITTLHSLISVVKAYIIPIVNNHRTALNAVIDNTGHHAQPRLRNTLIAINVSSGISSTSSLR